MNRHAEIAGGGIGGLSSAMMLARRGWTVRVHERSHEIREVGAGIFLKNNAIEALEEFGVFAALVGTGVQLERSQCIDPSGRILSERALVDRTRMHVFVRQKLMEVLRSAAEREGVEIATGSTAIAADPAGELVLETGRRLRADLVIAADGVRSRVRDSLNIGATYRSLPTLVSRYLIASRELTPDFVVREHWSGRCRIGITPCAKDMTYVYQVSSEADKISAALPNNVASWSRAFPRLRREIEILSRTAASQHNYSIVRCPRWQLGRVAIIGDAAHGLPPTLGQGVGLTLMNARALAVALDDNTNVDEVLPAWDAAVRFISDRTQRWALRYDYLTRQWPALLRFMRPTIIRALALPILNRRMRIADAGVKPSPRSRLSVR